MTNMTSQQILIQAEKMCLQRGVRLTSQRAEVLRLMAEQPGSISAYDLLDQLRISEPQAKPPTVYRALDFLLEHGLIHRLASLNAYIGCNRPHQAHQGHFLICRLCKVARELPHDEIDIAVEQAAAALSFQVENQVVEVSGVCAPCREQA